MIRFAIKSLVVMLLVGHALKLAEPSPVANSSVAAQAHFLPADYSQDAVLNARRPDIALALWPHASPIGPGVRTRQRRRTGLPIRMMIIIRLRTIMAPIRSCRKYARRGRKACRENSAAPDKPAAKARSA